MMTDRDRFAMDIYLRLLDQYGNSRNEDWMRQEAYRLADAFLSHVPRKTIKGPRTA